MPGPPLTSVRQLRDKPMDDAPTIEDVRADLMRMPSGMRASYALAVALAAVLGSPRTDEAGDVDGERADAMIATLQRIGFEIRPLATARRPIVQ